MKLSIPFHNKKIRDETGARPDGTTSPTKAYDVDISEIDLNKAVEVGSVDLRLDFRSLNRQRRGDNKLTRCDIENYLDVSSSAVDFIDHCRSKVLSDGRYLYVMIPKKEILNSNSHLYFEAYKGVINERVTDNITTVHNILTHWMPYEDCHLPKAIPIYEGNPYNFDSYVNFVKKYLSFHKEDNHFYLKLITPVWLSNEQGINLIDLSLYRETICIGQPETHPKYTYEILSGFYCGKGDSEFVLPYKKALHISEDYRHLFKADKRAYELHLGTSLLLDYLRQRHTITNTLTFRVTAEDIVLQYTDVILDKLAALEARYEDVTHLTDADTITKLYSDSVELAREIVRDPILLKKYNISSVFANEITIICSFADKNDICPFAKLGY